MNPIPDAVAAVIAATLREWPAASPEAQARSAVAALRAEGWYITAPDVAPAFQHAA